MLKNIRLHLEKDEEKQATLDDVLAKKIVETRRNNINAFQRNIPSLIPYITQSKLSSLSLFNNKYGETNIVDYGVGRTLYGFHPQQEIEQQVFQALRRCPRIDLVHPNEHVIQLEDSSISFDYTQLKSFKVEQAQSLMSEEVECLIVLGCGLGLHIKQLLESRIIKNLIIYEPEIQYFQCSTMAISWSDIFALAKDKGTTIFLQIEKDGRDLLNDINELKRHTSLSSFNIYKHYNHEIFDSLYRDICERDWNDIFSRGFTITSIINKLEYIPTWTPKIDLSKQSPVSTESKLLETNLKAFEKYFPNIHKQYKDYKPKIWLPINSQANEINLLKAQGLYSWYGESPKQDCVLNFDNFSEQPNKDGLVLGYSGTKLAHYIHYQFVNETQKLLEDAKEEIGALPDKVSSIIMFGLGVGYQLEKLLDEHSVEKLFICEPNPDFFYASLFAIDWQKIFEKVESSDSRIYLNIGDDGTNLFRDLLSQFNVIGPYILNSTYFYQSYYNASLNSAIRQLREQLKIVISMGEYFDHAYYGIAHTKEGMRRKTPTLCAKPAEKLSYDDKDVPIFIIGNGPSLDNSIEAIKEWQGQAIVVSCGTALQALHRHGITPDFHAEIEQNRSTFDWAVLIGDLNYLKNITLISCNGIHPDTCDLYKNVMVAFKEGESSTISALNVLGRENFTTLLNAYPTVSNFAIDLFSTIGFTSIYLIGVDLGFVDVKHHHSKSSGYYQDSGQETYDYAATANTSLIVPGNFRSIVNTKHEFKVSKQVIEQVTGAKPKWQEFYNCSDGAKIQGALPIRPDELLIVATPLQKIHAIKKLNTTIFSNSNLDDYVEKFEALFSQELLIAELNEFETLLGKEISTREDIEFIINKQREILFRSYKNGKSLLFYYLYGTVNYANAILTKLMSISFEDNSFIVNLAHAKNYWFETIKKIKLELLNTNDAIFDVSTYNVIIRELECFKLNYKNEELIIITDDFYFKQISLYFLKLDSPWLKVSIITLSESKNLHYSPDYCIFFITKKIKKTPIEGKISTIIVTDSIDSLNLSDKNNVTYFAFPNVYDEYVFKDSIWIVRQAIRACLNAHNSSIILPRYWTSIVEPFNNDNFSLLNDKYFSVDFNSYICLYNQDQPPSNNSRNGTIGKVIHRKLLIKDLLMPLISNEEMKSMKERHLEIKRKILDS